MNDTLLGKGIPNIGNTCYIASIIQCLRYSKPFVFKFRNHDTQKDTALIRTFIELLYASATKQIYTSFVSNLAINNQEFRLLRQCDAHELYLFLIDSIFTKLNTYDNVFQGKLQSRIECKECGQESITETPFISLSLEMAADNTCHTITDLLANFFSLETLDDKIDCISCKTKRISTKQLNVSEAPKILVIHLKRFNGLMKNTQEIKFSKQMKAFHNMYTLFAACNHSGGTSGGHYTAACKKRNETWILCNDNFITDLNKMPTQSALPYILFYQRV